MPDLIRLLRALPRAVLVFLAVAVTPAKADAPPKFSQYPVKEAYAGPVAVPKISTKTNPGLLRAYRDADKTKVNAAGRYVMLRESCGASCVLGHLLDARTGHIIRVPFTVSGWRETEDDFNGMVGIAGSRLFVFRGMRNEEGINGVHYYTLEANGRFKHLRSDDTDGNFEKPLAVD